MLILTPWIIIDSDNGFSYERHEAITWTNSEFIVNLNLEKKFKWNFYFQGKGDMKTWWLTGKDDPPPDAMDKLNGELDKLLLNDHKGTTWPKSRDVSKPREWPSIQSPKLVVCSMCTVIVLINNGGHSRLRYFAKLWDLGFLGTLSHPIHRLILTTWLPHLRVTSCMRLEKRSSFVKMTIFNSLKNINIFKRHKIWMYDSTSFQKMQIGKSVR